MEKPEILVKDNLIMPIKATQKRAEEIKKELETVKSPISLNGLFLMLVSYIESMQKEILVYFLKYHPESIADNKNIKIDKSALLKNKNFNLTENIVEEYIDGTPYWQCTKLLYKTLKINKPNNGLNSQIKKIREDRNELVHKNLSLNFKQKWVRYENHISSEDLDYYLEKYDEYLTHLHEEIEIKYSTFTKINALKNLWDYTFQTPLCANFEDFWHIDFENDVIRGFKKPKIANGLSHSEKFLLEIWRSQVTDYKVDFLNLASLGPKVQARLHMFLKLSNDIFLYQ